MLKEFKDFLLKQNIFALAIAVVVGTALNTLVKALVDNFIMPVVAVVTPKGDWQQATWNLGPLKFGIGPMLAALLNFAIIGFVAWRLAKLFMKPEVKPVTQPCPFCRTAIDPAALRCPHCTSDLVSRPATVTAGLAGASREVQQSVQ
jgi:large conductance mechanosensitive channel